MEIGKATYCSACQLLVGCLVVYYTTVLMTNTTPTLPASDQTLSCSQRADFLVLTQTEPAMWRDVTLQTAQFVCLLYSSLIVVWREQINMCYDTFTVGENLGNHGSVFWTISHSGLWVSFHCRCNCKSLGNLVKSYWFKSIEKTVFHHLKKM